MQDLRTRPMPLLIKANVVYRAQHSRDEIELLTEVYAEALAEEDVAAIGRAFGLYFQRGKYFPTPAHILELLPECRPLAVSLAKNAENARVTPGFGAAIAREIAKSAKRGFQESNEEVCRRVMASLSEGVIQ